MAFYSNMTIENYQVWSPKIGVKSFIGDGKGKNEYKSNPYYSQFTPFKYFRDNIVFEMPANMTIS